jgi:ABC-type branched-subunit amino acid transport system substrate-binding protein
MRVFGPAIASALMLTTIVSTGALVGGSGIAGAAAKKPALQVMDIGTFASPSLAQPDTLWSAQAEFDAINAAGGINGQKVVVTGCNDQDSQNIAAACARKAVSAHDFAVLAMYEQYGAQILPILQKAGIPYMDGEATALVDLQNPDSFPFDAGIYTVFAGLGEAMNTDGCKNIGMIVLGGIAVTELAASVVQGIAKANNIPFEEAQVGLTEPDFTSPVETLTAAGATCIGMTLTPSEGPLAVQAIAQSGAKVTVFSSEPQFTNQALVTLGSEANGIIEVGDEYVLSTPGIPGVSALKADMSKYLPGKSISDDFSVGGFGLVYAMDKIASTIKGNITAKNFKAAVEKTTHVNTDGIYGPMSFKTSAGVAGAPRLFNPTFLTFQIEDAAPLVKVGFQKVPGSLISVGS